jgi:hypothetical protein
VTGSFRPASNITCLEHPMYLEKYIFAIPDYSPDSSSALTFAFATSSRRPTQEIRHYFSTAYPPPPSSYVVQRSMDLFRTLTLPTTNESIMTSLALCLAVSRRAAYTVYWGLCLVIFRHVRNGCHTLSISVYRQVDILT